MANKDNYGETEPQKQEKNAQIKHISGANLGAAAANSGNTGLEEVISWLPRPQREKFISGYDVKKFAKIFEDDDMMRTVDAFLENGMNASETARALYMHRNTLSYRLKTVQKKTGLDLKNFDMAVTFKILHILYTMK